MRRRSRSRRWGCSSSNATEGARGIGPPRESSTTSTLGSSTSLATRSCGPYRARRRSASRSPAWAWARSSGRCSRAARPRHERRAGPRCRGARDGHVAHRDGGDRVAAGDRRPDRDLGVARPRSWSSTSASEDANSPDELVGRIASTARVMALGSMPIGMLVGGVLIDTIGSTDTLADGRPDLRRRGRVHAGARAASNLAHARAGDAALPRCG